MRSHSGRPTTRNASGENEVEDPLRRPLEPAQHRRPQLEQRDALAGDVLALVDEELGGRRGELHLDAVAVGELDDVEHGLLVEVRLGEHELVGTSLLEERRQPVERASEARGARVDCEPPHDLEPDPAAGRLERALEVGDGRLVTDEQEPSPHPRQRHQLEGDRVVRSAQEPDRERARDDGCRDQPGGREVVVRAEPEREHDQRDENEGGEDPSRARPPLARRVEPGLENTITVIGARNGSQSAGPVSQSSDQ